MKNPFKKRNGSMDLRDKENNEKDPGVMLPLTEKSDLVADTEKNPKGDKDVDERGNWENQIEFVLSCIGYAVGIGNLWRFPYLCMRNGGGAFLIPYFLSMILCGMPLFFLELSIGQFSSKSPLQVWSICPLFKGLGYGMVIVSGIVCIYYNIIITWVLYYLFKSFAKTLPWSKCGNWWNTPLCLIRSKEDIGNLTATLNSSLIFANASDSVLPSYGNLNEERIFAARTYANLTSLNDTIPWKSPAEEFWQHGVLELSPGIDEPNGVKWELFGCLVLSWVIVYLCLFKGVQSSGKVVYVTATTPYIFLTLLLIRGLLLPGAMNGIKYFIIPDWSKLLEFKVWAEASLQIFYSLGPAWGGLITMSSYNKFNNNCMRDGILVPLVNCGTSFYGGFVIFSVIGFMAHEAGLPVKDVVTSGPGLAFIAYPEAITKLPISPMWAIFFFIMLLTLGLDTQFGMLETVTSSLVDQFPKYLRKHKIAFTGVICVAEIFVGIPLTTRAGMYVFQIMDWYVGSFSVMVISFFECMIVSWIYGHDRIYSDIEMMIGYKPSVWWKICWGYISPIILLVITCYNMIAMGEPYYGNYFYPNWAIVMGWMIGVCSIVPIPIFFIRGMLQQTGTFVERLKKGMKPDHEWGPADPELKAQYQYKGPESNFFASPLLCVNPKSTANGTVVEEKRPYDHSNDIHDV